MTYLHSCGVSKQFALQGELPTWSTRTFPPLHTHRTSRRMEELQRRAMPEATGLPVMVASSLDSMRARHESMLLKAERNTWLLLDALYNDRILHATELTFAEDQDRAQRMLMLSQVRIKKNLVERSRAYRESRVLLTLCTSHSAHAHPKLTDHRSFSNGWSDWLSLMEFRLIALTQGSATPM